MIAFTTFSLSGTSIVYYRLVIYNPHGILQFFNLHFPAWNDCALCIVHYFSAQPIVHCALCIISVRSQLCIVHYALCITSKPPCRPQPLRHSQYHQAVQQRSPYP